MGRLTDRIAIVTGAGSGIGRAAVELFAQEGARVVAVDLAADAGRSAAEAAGGVAVAGDVADPELWDRAVAAAEGLGGLDVAFLNAGLYGHSGPIDELPVETYARTVAANIGGVVLGTRAVVPALRARGGGAIVATASVAGIVAFAGNPLYTATKHAVTGFVGAVAPGLAADAITIDAVCPAVVDTPMTEGALGGLDAAALGIELIEPADIARAALSLATTEGTGRCLVVRAGAEPHEWTPPTWADLAAAPR
jgi:NAD(P)-dependent dehydrogenase (short-subunit alcohol dehydrogenase family)